MLTRSSRHVRAAHGPLTRASHSPLPVSAAYAEPTTSRNAVFLSPATSIIPSSVATSWRTSLNPQHVDSVPATCPEPDEEGRRDAKHGQDGHRWTLVPTS